MPTSTILEITLSTSSKPIGRVLSLFTGAGGLDLGLEQAGLETVACLEIDPDARAVLASNRPNWSLPQDGDVNVAANRLTPESLGLRVGELDLIAGGPPCQPFSVAAQWKSTARSGMRDERATCVHGMMTLVEKFLPAGILIENVAGFLQGRDSAEPVIRQALAAINKACGTEYSLTWAVVDAADFGVPQHRRRAIAVAYRDGRDVRLPAPTHSNSPVSAWDALHDVAADEKPLAKGYWSGLLPSIPEGSNYLHLTARGDGEELFGWRTRYWSFLLKLARDRPSWTLSASPGPSTGPFHWENRPLSVREQMRLQTFPDSWRIEMPYNAGRRLVGNATPPLLAEVLGRMIVCDLQMGSKAARMRLLRSPVSLAFERQQHTPPPAPPMPVPESYRRHIGSKEAHPGEGLGPAPRQIASA